MKETIAVATYMRKHKCGPGRCDWKVLSDTKIIKLRTHVVPCMGGEELYEQLTRLEG